MTDRIVSGVLRGSFTGTGQSGEIHVFNGMLNLNFGSGSVTLQRLGANGTWYDVLDGTYTADVAVNIDGHGVAFRLNCTSYSSEIAYEIHRG